MEKRRRAQLRAFNMRNRIGDSEESFSDEVAISDENDTKKESLQRNFV